MWKCLAHRRYLMLVFLSFPYFLLPRQNAQSHHACVFISQLCHFPKTGKDACPSFSSDRKENIYLVPLWGSLCCSLLDPYSHPTHTGYRWSLSSFYRQENSSSGKIQEAQRVENSPLLWPSNPKPFQWAMWYHPLQAFLAGLTSSPQILRLTEHQSQLGKSTSSGPQNRSYWHEWGQMPLNWVMGW